MTESVENFRLNKYCKNTLSITLKKVIKGYADDSNTDLDVAVRRDITAKSKAEYLADFLCLNAAILAQELTNQSCDNLVTPATTKPLSFTELSSWFKGES